MSTGLFRDLLIGRFNVGCHHAHLGPSQRGRLPGSDPKDGESMGDLWETDGKHMGKMGFEFGIRFWFWDSDWDSDFGILIGNRIGPNHFKCSVTQHFDHFLSVAGILPPRKQSPVWYHMFPFFLGLTLRQDLRYTPENSQPINIIKNMDFLPKISWTKNSSACPTLN